MGSKRYLYINKYFAFAFMVFAVLSSVSDKYDEVDAVSQADWNLAYFLDVNNLFIQSSGNITAQFFINKFNDFSLYVQGILAKPSTGDIYTIIALGILFFDALCMNNKIMQNNIWRKVVF